MFENIAVAEVEALAGPLVIGKIEQFLGVTVAQTVTFLNAAAAQTPGISTADAVTQTVGWFRHALRVGSDSSQHAFGGLVDAFFPIIEPTITAYVQAVAAQAPTPAP